MHTPGPWKATPDKPNAHRYQIVANAHDNILAEVLAYGVGMVDEGETAPWHNARDNANLIAAAPELLEALKGIFEQCALVHKRWGDGNNLREATAAIDTARAAIAKAEGR